MQVETLLALPQRTPMHGITAEEALLQGATLPCSLWQKANLMNQSPLLMDNHIKMMDPYAILTHQTLNSSVSQWKHYAGREHQSRLCQVTVCHRHRTLYGGQPPTPPCHKSSTIPPATSVQPSLCLNKPHCSSIALGIAVQTPKL